MHGFMYKNKACDKTPSSFQVAPITFVSQDNWKNLITGRSNRHTIQLALLEVLDNQFEDRVPNLWIFCIKFLFRAGCMRAHMINLYN